MNLDNLFDNINERLKNNKLEQLKTFLEDYTSDDWLDYMKIDKNKYNRYIFKKNDLFELVIITWDANQETRLHGHPENGCLFKVLQGNIDEYLYKNIDSKEFKINKFSKNDVSYIDDKKGFHSMKNNYNNTCVSIHIYSPPFK